LKHSRFKEGVSMSGQNAPDDAGRLEAALDRIARAAAHRPAQALRAGSPIATSPADAASTGEVAARLDALIADLRVVLGTQ
jgi:hypothetical protein